MNNNGQSLFDRIKAGNIQPPVQQPTQQPAFQPPTPVNKPQQTPVDLSQIPVQPPVQPVVQQPAPAQPVQQKQQSVTAEPIQVENTPWYSEECTNCNSQTIKGMINNTPCAACGYLGRRSNDPAKNPDNYQMQTTETGMMFIQSNGQAYEVNFENAGQVKTQVKVVQDNAPIEEPISQPVQEVITEQAVQVAGEVNQAQGNQQLPFQFNFGQSNTQFQPEQPEPQQEFPGTIENVQVTEQVKTPAEVAQDYLNSTNQVQETPDTIRMTAKYPAENSCSCNSKKSGNDISQEQANTGRPMSMVLDPDSKGVQQTGTAVIEGQKVPVGVKEGKIVPVGANTSPGQFVYFKNCAIVRSKVGSQANELYLEDLCSQARHAVEEQAAVPWYNIDHFEYMKNFKFQVEELLKVIAAQKPRTHVYSESVGNGANDELEAASRIMVSVAARTISPV